ncbi:hypothetical protein AQUSIP_13030 [Aquicella siphonis]|uniref:Uncharacterized protein n=1 Tax=Aquicella siphonis TaxID=254247 RepID=A0A5E4PHX0_9COXI|nr:hypothetical protein [Aquicella siphonis]VVC76002.1 hypothetical protein AQUSIP_13030 [Aquicella siphonis]
MSQAYNPADVHTPYDVGQVLQAEMSLSDMGLVDTVPANDSINSNLLFMNGYKFFAFALTSTQNGDISIQRYVDRAGLIAQGAALTGSLTAATPFVYTLTDTKPFQSMKITINNSAGSDAALTNVLLLMQAN